MNDDSLRHYVPPQIARVLIANGGRLEPVETEATILMCDIEGFAALTDALGPRATFDFLNRYFELLVTLVERRGGVVTQFQGDAILAAFNVPNVDPDHPASALGAGLDMVRACEAGPCAGARVRNRVGIATGRVIAGPVGSHGQLSYTVHGNAVNLAARLEMLNKDYGTRVLLTAETARRCAGIGLRKIADAQVRGYVAPVALYAPA